MNINPRYVSWVAGLGFALGLNVSLALAAGGSVDADGKRTSRISDESVYHIDPMDFPQRPKPILELGNDFLGPGNIGRGWELPTGAVWQPSLVVFGTYRSALQSFDVGDEVFSEWANRADLFANLQLSGSERFLLGIRSLDKDGEFTSYRFSPDGTGSNEKGWNNQLNAEIVSAFFEGDFSEIFPNLDPNDTRGLDYGFAVGRQQLLYQEGLLVNDSLDAIGVTRNTLLPTGGSDLQITFLFGWGDIHRHNNLEIANNKLFGLNFAADYRASTLNADFFYVDDRNGTSDGFFWGVSDVRRVGHYNLSTRLLGSHALEEESDIVRDGVLLFAELSWVPAWTDNHVYVNGFLAIDEFTSAARGPATGGPLGRTGIQYRAIGLGRYGASLGNQAAQSFGGAFGYQWFIDPAVNQVIFELGFRQSTNDDFEEQDAIAGAISYRHVLGQHTVVQFDMFSAINFNRANSSGGRVELRVEF
ncbi:MAG: hypothetical protein CMQ05_18745 [Gammaproteobacteria bacterium]|nr:hypothetical protein [Gammaproteobacteria bacterium]RPG24517.1 MAG: hypothetical protein CBC10_010975 [Gammaproteobacteria bacterium TMED50]